jgi:hypothetical protein
VHDYQSIHRQVKSNIRKRRLVVLLIAILLGNLSAGFIGSPVPVYRHPRAVHQPTKAELKAYLAHHYTGDEIQFECLDALITMESHWNPRAINPSSGAYGIGQALPPAKMKVAGADYMTNPYTQINWLLKYTKSRYRNSGCRALYWHLKKGWW